MCFFKAELTDMKYFERSTFTRSLLHKKRMGPFGAAHGRHTYSTMMKLGTVKPYLKKIQKLYKSRDTPLEFC